MTPRKTYGTTTGGKQITEQLVTELNRRAEEGSDVEEILERRRGRPLIGSAPATVESVRLDPELREALVGRAKRDQRPTSEIVRAALRQYLGKA